MKELAAPAGAWLQHRQGINVHERHRNMVADRLNCSFAIRVKQLR